MRNDYEKKEILRELENKGFKKNCTLVQEVIGARNKDEMARITSTFFFNKKNN